MRLLYRKLVAYLVQRLQCRVMVVVYPPAPKSTYKNTYPYVIHAISDLYKANEKEEIILAGDSAGSAMALYTAQQIKENNLKKVSALIMMTPWLDLEMANPKCWELNHRDCDLGEVGKNLALF